MTVAAAPRRYAPGFGAVVAAIVVLFGAAAAGFVTAVTGSVMPMLGALMVALGIVLVLRPELGIVIFLGLLWLNVPAVAVAFHGVPNLASEASVVLLLVPVARYLLQREPVIVTPAFVALLAFVAANLLSAAASTNPAAASRSVSTLLGEGLLLYILVSNAVRTPRMARTATLALVVASATLSGLAIHQEVTRSYEDNYFGFAQNNLQDDATEDPGAPDARPRMTGPIGEQNRFAQVLLVTIPLALFGLGVRGTGRARWLSLGAAMLILGGILLTFSRGALVGLAVVAAVLVIRRYVRLSHMVAVAMALLLTVVIIAPDTLARVGSIGAVAGWVTGEGDVPDGAIVGRTTSNIAAVLVFVDHPILGVGPDVYAQDYSLLYANRLGLRFFEEERRAHNMYLEWAAELGIVGLAAGLAVIVITLVQLASLRGFWLSRRREYADLAGAYTLAVVAYATTAVFLHLSYVRYFFVLLALANAVIWILSRERDRLAATDPDPAATGG
jgi:O-antigen ligase